MTEPMDPRGDDAIRDALKSALSSSTSGGGGSWTDIARRIRRRRAGRFAVRMAIPAVCLVLVVAGIVALSLRTGNQGTTSASAEETSPTQAVNSEPPATRTSDAGLPAVSIPPQSTVVTVTTTLLNPQSSTSSSTSPST